MDFAGPFEVFSVMNELHDDRYFDIEVVAPDAGPIRAKNGLSINPDRSIEEIRGCDILIIPGGSGTRKLLKDDTVLDWVQSVGGNAQHTLSVCTGSLVLAKCGLLDGLRATTHHEAFDRLEALAPKTGIERNMRFVDNGQVITSAGISAGIDMSLHVIRKLLGDSVVKRTAEYMEYQINEFNR